MGRKGQDVNAQYHIINRCTQGMYTLGYGLRGIRSGQEIVVDRASVIRLAIDGLIDNATAQLSAEKGYTLNGVGCNLTKLPINKISNDWGKSDSESDMLKIGISKELNTKAFRTAQYIANSMDECRAHLCGQSQVRRENNLSTENVPCIIYNQMSKRAENDNDEVTLCVRIDYCFGALDYKMYIIKGNQILYKRKLSEEEASKFDFKYFVDNDKELDEIIRRIYIEYGCASYENQFVSTSKRRFLHLCWSAGQSLQRNGTYHEFIQGSGGKCGLVQTRQQRMIGYIDKERTKWIEVVHRLPTSIIDILIVDNFKTIAAKRLDYTGREEEEIDLPEIIYKSPELLQAVEAYMPKQRKWWPFSK